MGAEEIKSIFGNQVRVRVMGLLVEEEKLLLISHSGLNSENELWLPPGGGVEVGETVEKALKREFAEETGLEIKVKDFLGVNEFIASPLHAIELFFSVEQVGGNLRLGHDPEMNVQTILKEVSWLSITDLKSIRKTCLHGLLHDIESVGQLFAKRGFFNLGNNP